MKIVSALVLFLTLALPVFAQDATDEAWIHYTSFFDVMRFDAPADWDVIERSPYTQIGTYSRVALHHDDDAIELDIESLNDSIWGDFNLPRTTDFDTLIAKAVRWRWTDYTLVELGGRQFIYHAEMKHDAMFSYWTTFRDTGILETVIAVTPPDHTDTIRPIAEQVAASVEYVGDAPVDLTCVPLDQTHTFPVKDGNISVMTASSWAIKPYEPQFVKPGNYAFQIRKDEQISTPNTSRDCFTVPQVRFDLLIFSDPDYSLDDFERDTLKDLIDGKEHVSVDHVTLNGQPGLVISSWDDESYFDSQEYVGFLPNGYRYYLLFRSIPGQGERWQGLALQMAESIRFTPAG